MSQCFLLARAFWVETPILVSIIVIELNDIGINFNLFSALMPCLHFLFNYDALG